MKLICGQCHTSFYNYNFRSVCFTCSPHPKVSSPAVVLQLHQSGLSYGGIALRLGVTKALVSSYVINYGVSRLRREKLPFGRVELNKEWLDGWLLGDGHIEFRDGGKNARFKHGSSKEEYVCYVLDAWVRMGFRGKKAPPFFSRRGNIVYHAYSHVHPTINELYNRWYPHGVKIIPQDIIITPVSLREWYLGDGNLHLNFYPRLIMGGVTEQEVGMLFNLLTSIFGVGISRYPLFPSGQTSSGEAHKPIWHFYFSEVLALKFFSYIGICPLPCYSYKWPH